MAQINDKFYLDSRGATQLINKIAEAHNFNKAEIKKIEEKMKAMEEDLQKIVDFIKNQIDTQAVKTEYKEVVGD